ncbi:MAG: ASKHA domain-containing protein [Clostridiales Family XIII bacterium]|jgi:uncharacterized 2Fe-2S/4Fe-4S cluster protein (DUF4445 family)|nr:ASKHA domain-containing protein [Clostridiales Family XIII bacterium]
MIRITVKTTDHEADRIVLAERGDNLLDCLRNAGIPLRADCGGIGTCGKCRVTIDGTPALACMTYVTRDISVTLPTDTGTEDQISAERDDLLTAERAARAADTNTGSAAGCFAAVDLGTTTIAVSLIDRAAGNVLASASFLNPQYTFGADVISRINVSLDDSSKLSKMIRERIGAELASLLQTAGVGASGLDLIVIAGNTTMSYILLGLPCRSLGFAPFKPAFAAGGRYEAAELFGSGFADTKCLLVPYLSAFVGGDITSGLIATEREGDYLIIDMGTNGELAYMTGEKLLCTSTAAGPAFEGVNLTCGMGGTAGAVSKVWLDNGELQFKTIADAAARGICGSGVLDLMACLIAAGAVKANGKFNDEHPFVADRQVSLAGDVVFTQKDAREFQLAKSAVRSGVEILFAEAGAVPGKVLLAGGFGQHLDPESAFATGLLPESLRGRVTAAGNTSLAGAVRIGFDTALLDRAEYYAKKSREINLAAHKNFSDSFMTYMRFDT